MCAVCHCSVRGPCGVPGPGGDRPYTRAVIEAPPERGFRSVGQPVGERMLRLAAARAQLGRTLLVHGPPGAGKDAFLDDLLALLFCSHVEPGDRPCNACRGCRDARARAHQDLVMGSPAAWRGARSAGESIVAAARRWLLDAAGAPTIADRRVIVIEAADGANEQTQNALLKALEEPTDRHTYVLVADDAERLLPTIRSRCRHVRVGPLPRQTLTALLMDRMRLPADQADVLAQLSGGLAGAAFGFVREPGRLEWRRRTQSELLAMLRRGRADRLAAIRDLLDDAVRITPAAEVGEAAADEGASVKAVPGAMRDAALRVIDTWLDLARDMLVASLGRDGLAPSRELTEDFAVITREVGAAPIARAIRVLERVRAGIEQNAAPRLSLEAAVLGWPDLTRRAAGRDG
jgi:hypothetical protein